MNIIRFHSKECRRDKHSFCHATWEGFGFDVVCDCECHTAKVPDKQKFGILTFAAKSYSFKEDSIDD